LLQSNITGPSHQPREGHRLPERLSSKIVFSNARIQNRGGRVSVEDRLIGVLHF